MARVFNCTVHITPEACIAGAAIVLLVPLPLASAWILAAVWHELCHCLALKLCDKHIHEIVIGHNGAEMKTELLANTESVLCALAGPAGGFSLMLLVDFFPLLSLSGLLQSAFNLLPIYPLDGGRALHGLGNLLLPARFSNLLCDSVAVLLWMMVISLSLYSMVVLKLGILPLLFVIYFVVLTKKRKIPCK